MLINCVAYRDGRRLQDLSLGEIQPLLEAPDTFVWVALRDPDAGELRALQGAFDLHDLAVEDAVRGHQRPKLEEYGPSLFLVLHTVDMAHSDLELGEMAVFAGANYVLTVRSGSGQDFRSVRERCEREPELLRQGPAFVVYALMDAVVDRYFPVAEALEAELESLEQDIFEADSPRHSVERLYQLKRRVNRLRHAVVPLLEATGRLHGGRVPTLCAGMQNYFRDVHDHLQRIGATVEHIRETIVTAMQMSLSMAAMEETEVNKRLAAWAAIFAVATVLAGIWGMNFDHMPELDWRFGYPAALLVMGGVCGYLFYRFRRARWL